MIQPTITDVTRAVDKLNAMDEDSHESVYLACNRVADNLSFVLSRSVNLKKLTKREVILILISHGVNDDIANKYGDKIARLVRGYHLSRSRLSAIW